MKFIHCKRDPHKDWGINDPVNLEHCLSYSEGTVSDKREGREKPQAHAILFTMLGCLKPIVWTFVDERHRDWELGRLVELTYQPRDKDELEAIFAERGIETRVSELAKDDAPATMQEAGAAFAELLDDVFGRLSKMRAGFVERVERGQRGAA